MIVTEVVFKASRFSSMVSAFTKTARKYAEVSYNRLGVISAKASADDLLSFATAVAALCEKSQVS